MAKKSKIKIPKELLGFKFSKGTRKDLRKLAGMMQTPSAKGIGLALAGALIEHLGEKAKEADGPQAKPARKAQGAPRSH